MRAAADRAAGRPFFLASVLREYQDLRGMDDEQLANELGCELDDLPRLALCRRPEREAGRFRADVERIAERFGVVPIVLARVVREVDAARQLRRDPSSSNVGDLLAARDRDVGERLSSVDEPGQLPEAPAGEPEAESDDDGRG